METFDVRWILYRNPDIITGDTHICYGLWVRWDLDLIDHLKDKVEHQTLEHVFSYPYISKSPTYRQRFNVQYFDDALYRTPQSAMDIE